MAICHAIEIVLPPIFPDNTLEDSLTFINKANIRQVQFEPPDNCPEIIKLREQGILPWSYSIDFLKNGTKQINDQL
jgi:hypothetical protein